MPMRKCPHCKKFFLPNYLTKETARAAVATGYGDLMDVEQHISGVCSQKCWDEMFPPEKDEKETGLL